MPGSRCRPCYFTFHTKAEVLIASLELAGGEPDSPAVVMERAWIGRVMEAQTGGRRLALIVEHSNDIYARVGPLLPAVSAASSVDPDVGRAWQGLVARRRTGMGRVIDVFAARGELRDGLDPSLALDLVFGINRAETYLAFTVECGWTMERYKAWQFATLADQLLPPGWRKRLWRTDPRRWRIFRSGMSSACSPERDAKLDGGQTSIGAPAPRRLRGIAPICSIRPTWSATPQCSTRTPSSNRRMSKTSVSIA